MYAAWINDESREPLKILHSIPSENYCVEVINLPKHTTQNLAIFFADRENNTADTHKPCRNNWI